MLILYITAQTTTEAILPTKLNVGFVIFADKSHCQDLVQPLRGNKIYIIKY